MSVWYVYLIGGLLIEKLNACEIFGGEIFLP